MREWQLDSLSDFLLLHVQPTDICIGNVRFLINAQHCDGRVGFRREDVDQRVGVTVERDRRRWFEFLAVEGGKYSDDIVRPSGRLNDASADETVSIMTGQMRVEMEYF